MVANSVAGFNGADSTYYNNFQNMGYQNFTMPMMPNMMGMNGSLFTQNMGQMTGVNSYADDICFSQYVNSNPMYAQTGSIFPYQNYNMQNPQTSFTGANPYSIADNQEDVMNPSAYGQPAANNPQTAYPQNNGNELGTPTTLDNMAPKLNTFKKLGITAGVSIPLISGISKMLKGAKFANVFKFKELAVKLPVLAVAGWAVGSLIDGIIGSSNKNNTQNNLMTAR